MPILRAQVAMNMVSGILEDRPTNVWHFEGLATSTVAGEINTLLTNFYGAVGSLYPGTVAQNGHSLKIYNTEDPEPRAPFYDSTFNLTQAPSGTTLPSEVAMCLSFQADRLSGVNQASRRGRIYFGPIDTVQLDTNGRPTSAAISVLRGAGNSLLTASQAALNSTWIIYSPTTGAGTPVDNGWVDNAFDTQRRRGLVATSRNVFP